MYAENACFLFLEAVSGRFYTGHEYGQIQTTRQYRMFFRAMRA